MEIIDSSEIFSTPVEIFLCNLLKMSLRPLTPQNLLAPFNNEEVKEHGQNPLNYLNIVKEMPQTCKVEWAK